MIQYNEKTYTEQEYSELIAPVVNNYYLLMEAADMFQHLMEKLLAVAGMGVKGRVKYRHKMIMQNVQLLKNNIDAFLTDYNGAFKGDWAKYDELRRCAAYISRLLLLINDRTYNSEKVEQDIEQYIRSLEAANRVDERFINYFKIK